MSDEKAVFAKRLNYYMERNGKSQSDLISDLGINKSTISTWCNGTKMPRMGTIQTLADYFGVMKSDLIEEKTDTADNEMDEGERLLLNLYRSLPDREKTLLKEQAKLLKNMPDQ